MTTRNKILSIYITYAIFIIALFSAILFTDKTVTLNFFFTLSVLLAGTLSTGIKHKVAWHISSFIFYWLVALGFVGFVITNNSTIILIASYLGYNLILSFYISIFNSSEILRKFDLESSDRLKINLIQSVLALSICIIIAINL